MLKVISVIFTVSHSNRDHRMATWNIRDS